MNQAKGDQGADVVVLGLSGTTSKAGVATLFKKCGDIR